MKTFLFVVWFQQDRATARPLMDVLCPPVNTLSPICPCMIILCGETSMCMSINHIWDDLKEAIHVEVAQIGSNARKSGSQQPRAFLEMHQIKQIPQEIVSQHLIVKWQINTNTLEVKIF